MLADAGIPLGCQTVLLKGVNDDPEVMKKLMHELLMARVRPYYIYMADQVAGGEHFRTTVQTGLEIMKALRGWTSGLAIPHFVIDAPGGGGKIPLLPEYVEEHHRRRGGPAELPGRAVRLPAAAGGAGGDRAEEAPEADREALGLATPRHPERSEGPSPPSRNLARLRDARTRSLAALGMTSLSPSCRTDRRNAA